MFYSYCPRSPKIHILTHTILAFHPSIPGSLCSAPPLSQKSEVLSQNHLNQVWEGLEVDSSQGKILSSGESLKVHVTASKIHWWDRPRGRPCHSKRGETGKKEGVAGPEQVQTGRYQPILRLEDQPVWLPVLPSRPTEVPASLPRPTWCSVAFLPSETKDRRSLVPELAVRGSALMVSLLVCF